MAAAVVLRFSEIIEVDMGIHPNGIGYRARADGLAGRQRHF